MGDADGLHSAAVSVAVGGRSRVGMRGGGRGAREIVEVQGGHIMRSMGRKDRHSKVCTSKGPRDRRVRLSAHTAIQFYDVQDRLGYDRPSKAVDWLIKKAKAAIDQLAELHAWKPAAATVTAAAGSSHREPEPTYRTKEPENQSLKRPQGQDQILSSSAIDSSSNHEHIDGNGGFLPHSLDTDSIADTVKSFFPTGAAIETQQQPPSPSPAALQSMQFQGFAHPSDLLSRTSSRQSQDLRLSLHSSQDPTSLHHHHQQSLSHEPLQPAVAAVGFSGTNHRGFATSPTSSMWSNVARFQRMPAWTTAATGDTGGGSGGAFIFGSQPMPQPIVGQSQGESQNFYQRGSLQSSSMPSVRAWINPIHRIQHQSIEYTPASSGHVFETGSFLGYHIPARIQGQEEDHEDSAILNKLSSASSDSRH